MGRATMYLSQKSCLSIAQKRSSTPLSRTSTIMPFNILNAPSGLLLAEEILQIMREAVRGTDLWSDSSINSNEMLEPGTSFADLRIASDGGNDYDLFLLKHWYAARGDKADSTNFFVARKAEPQGLKIRTYSRLAYLQALKDWATALDGKQVQLSEHRSWTWESSLPTSTGRSLYRTAYELYISLAPDDLPFMAKRWLKTAALDVCRAKDPRADRCIHQLAEEAGLPTGHISSAEWSTSGIQIECETEKAAEKVLAALFSDCKAKIEPGKRGQPTTLNVALA